MRLTKDQTVAEYTSTIILYSCRGFCFCYYGQICLSLCLLFILAEGSCTEAKLQSKYMKKTEKYLK